MNRPSDTTTPPKRRYSTPEGRWAGIGPYYAMFPTAFADEVIRNYTQRGDAVMDPFAGRGTAVFSAAIRHRPAIGIEINPLGFVYANAKLKPGSHNKVVRRLEELATISGQYQEEASALPEFFHCCFSEKIREFLLTARANLNWRQNNADRTLMALILISLHGKIGQSLSNQMRQSTAMAPDYCIRWWREKGLTPLDLDPVAFLGKRIQWRYRHGAPKTKNATVYLGNSSQKLPRLARTIQTGKRPKVKLLFTSPPYHNVTNYYYDQWLRLWMLGGPEYPYTNTSNRYGGKFSNYDQYRQLLNQVFTHAKPILRDDAIIYVRTDRRKSTYYSTRDALIHNFPEKNITEIAQPLDARRQTKPYSRGGAPKQANCEVDLILEPR